MFVKVVFVAEPVRACVALEVTLVDVIRLHVKTHVRVIKKSEKNFNKFELAGKSDLSK
jgi:hypothetical protein